MAKSFILTTAARNAACDAVVDLLDVGTGTESELIVATAASATDLVSIGLGATAFGAAATGVATVTTAPATGSATGFTGTKVAAKFRLVNQSDVKVAEGNVGVAATDFTMAISNTSIAPSDQIQLTAMTVTCPAGT